MFSPLHQFRKPRAYAKKGTFSDRCSITRSAGGILLAILLNYRIVLAVVWVVSVGIWLVLQVLPASPATLDSKEASLRVTKDPIPNSLLVSDTSTAEGGPNESRDGN